METRDVTQERWFGAGHSTATDPITAGAEAAEAAVAGRRPTLVIVFCSVSYELPKLVDAIRAAVAIGSGPDDPSGSGAHLPKVTIVGCTTSGQMTATGATVQSVVVSAWGGPGFQVRTRVALDAAARLRDTGSEVAEAVAGLVLPNRMLMLLCDGLAGKQHEIVRGAYAVLGAAVPMVGGCAGDDLAYHRTYQFHGDEDGVDTLFDAVVGVAIGSTAPLGIGVAHGWRKAGDAMIVTSSSGGRLYQLDGEPALDVYLRRIGADEALAADLEVFRETAFQHPLGLSRRSGEDIRVIHGADLSDRSLICLADVPQGALAWLMDTDVEALISGAGESCAQALSMLDGAEPIGLLAFDCAVRKTKLGPEGVRREVAEIVQRLGDTPFAGCYTNGEIARVRGSTGMHHLTLVTLAVA